MARALLAVLSNSFDAVLAFDPGLFTAPCMELAEFAIFPGRFMRSFRPERPPVAWRCGRIQSRHLAGNSPTRCSYQATL